MVQVCESLQSELKGSSVEVIQTVIVNMQDLNSLERVMRVASIISKTSAEMVYLVFMSDKEPRLEFADMDPLKYSMRLISEVKRADLKVFQTLRCPTLTLYIYQLPRLEFLEFLGFLRSEIVSRGEMGRWGVAWVQIVVKL